MPGSENLTIFDKSVLLRKTPVKFLLPGMPRREISNMFFFLKNIKISTGLKGC